MAFLRLKAFLPIDLRPLLLLLALLLPAARGYGQTAATVNSAGDLPSNLPATFSVALNHPEFASLDGLWRFYPGDDLRWAEPSGRKTTSA